ncbi:UNKNOWN [Stylonychia lemnae]|uniref:Uncharacterized protein n=1 Tax=Stylonychia lemnae TaxID=5949 RepID=A0A077ZQM8_STYLE|nr:UNKNOWN [Stylonychia lemnae]|eukprot:CDW71754.1 UNKNOWN [Stylonychia lemnae]
MSKYDLRNQRAAQSDAISIKSTIDNHQFQSVDNTQERKRLTSNQNEILDDYEDKLSSKLKQRFEADIEQKFIEMQQNLIKNINLMSFTNMNDEKCPMKNLKSSKQLGESARFPKRVRSQEYLSVCDQSDPLDCSRNEIECQVAQMKSYISKRKDTLSPVLRKDISPLPEDTLPLKPNLILNNCKRLDFNSVLRDDERKITQSLGDIPEKNSMSSSNNCSIISSQDRSKNNRSGRYNPISIYQFNPQFSGDNTKKNSPNFLIEKDKQIRSARYIKFQPSVKENKHLVKLSEDVSTEERNPMRYSNYFLKQKLSIMNHDNKENIEIQTDRMPRNQKVDHNQSQGYHEYHEISDIQLESRSCKLSKSVCGNHFMLQAVGSSKNSQRKQWARNVVKK